MFKKLLIVAAVSTAFAAHSSFAEQQQSKTQQSSGGQTSSQQLSQKQVEGEGVPVYIGSAGVMQIQQALNKAGFDVGNVDGQWGEETVQAVQNYQKSKGLEPTGTLTLSLVNSLGLNDVLTGKQAGGKRGTQEMAQGPGTPLYLDSAAVRQIQQALNKQGFDAGNVDGQWGESTAEAAANFQQAKGMEPTGMPDVNLISALGGDAQKILSGGGAQTSGGGMQGMQEAAAGPGVQLQLSPETVRQVEQALSKRGYEVGKVDGQWDEQAEQAALKFQRKQGLEPTGTLTPGLLAAVGMNDWLKGQGGKQQSGKQQSSGQSSGQSSQESSQQQ